MPNTMTELAKTARAWLIEDVVDLGRMAGNCGICGTAIRYEYYLRGIQKDTQLPTHIIVGSSCGPKLVDISTWKSMNKAYVETQRKTQSHNFKTMLGRYVHLRPNHEFMRNIYDLVMAGRELTVRQREVVEEVFSETQWETLEAGASVRARVEALLPKVNSQKTREMLMSFSNWSRRKELTGKQMDVLAKVERQANRATQAKETV